MYDKEIMCDYQSGDIVVYVDMVGDMWIEFY